MSPWATLGRVGARFETFFRLDIWSREALAQAGPGRRLLIMAARVAYIVVSGFGAERIKLRAAALTYVSLLSLVPALAVVFSIFTAFGGLEEVTQRLRSFIIESLAIGHQERVIEALEGFIDQASGPRLGAFGVSFLFITVVLLLMDIERAFNDIWGVRKDRSPLQRFQVYWPLITLGPLLLGLSLSTTAAVEASEAVRLLRERVPGVGLLTAFGPVLLSSIFLTLVYRVIPNTKVPVRHALVGGFVAGVLWTVAQRLYALYAANAFTYSVIYGSLGAIPLFIIWLYVSWVVALLGAAITFAAQSARTWEPAAREPSEQDRELMAARLVMSVAEHYVRGDGPTPVDRLLAEAGVRPRDGRVLLGELVAAGLLAETVTPGAAEPAYLPARPLETVTLDDVVQVVRHDHQGAALPAPEAACAAAVDHALEEAAAKASEVLAGCSLAKLLEGAKGQRDVAQVKATTP